MLSAQASWIWTKDRPIRPSHFVLFRKTFTLRSVKGTYLLHCAADSKYRLWINNIFCGTGPARGSPVTPYYDTYTVNPKLKSGANTFIFLVEFYTSGSIIFSAIHGGLIAALFHNNREIYNTSEDWECATMHGLKGIPAGYHHFTIFDAEKFPSDLKSCKTVTFSKSVVVKKNLLAAPEKLIPRPIPHLTHSTCHPESILSIGCSSSPAVPPGQEKNLALSLSTMQRSDLYKIKSMPVISAVQKWPIKPVQISPVPDSHIFMEIDFGKEILAVPYFELITDEKLTIDIGYSETLENNHVNPFRQNIFYAERILTRTGITKTCFNQPRGFRFMLLRISPQTKKLTIRRISASEEIYSPHTMGNFSCNDTAVNTAYTMCQDTLRLCMEDSFTDCPWRERQQWLGDLYIEIQSALYGFGAQDLVKKAIIEFISGITEEGWMPAVFPGTTNLNLPPFSMLFAPLLLEYFLFTGDTLTIRSAFPALMRVAAYLKKLENPEGFILTKQELQNTKHEKNIWHFVDWTKTDAHSGDGALQGLYLLFLLSMQDISSYLHESSAVKEFSAKAGELRTAIHNNYFDTAIGAYRKYRLSGETVPVGVDPNSSGQHENFLLPLLGCGTAVTSSQALNAAGEINRMFLPDLGGMQSSFRHDQIGSTAQIKSIYIGTPYFSSFALQALFNARMSAEALAYIRLCWPYMQANGSNTCWEMWGGATSLCHGFSTAPLFLLPKFILGIQPLLPGFKKFSASPRIDVLNSASGNIPSPYGKIFLQWKKQSISKNKSEYTIHLVVPKSSICVFSLPKKIKTSAIHINGRKYAFKKNYFLPPGNYKFSIIIKT